MKDSDQISYYCFNKACKASVYFYDSIEITQLPFNEVTLASEHHCCSCNSRLISVVDIELRQAMSRHLAQPSLVRSTYKVQV